MAHSPSDRVVIATRFSRLRPPVPGAEPPSVAELHHEALSALAEALDLLSVSVSSFLTNVEVDPVRRERLVQRAALLSDRVRELSALPKPPAPDATVSPILPTLSAADAVTRDPQP